MDKIDIKNLKRRYLVWLYKTTRESLEKIERKFTQLDIDMILLEELRTRDKNLKVREFIDKFEQYVHNKEKEGISLKFENKGLKPDYHFLSIKLEAIEEIITIELGKKSLAHIKLLYEKEMTQRILKSTDHK